MGRNSWFISTSYEHHGKGSLCLCQHHGHCHCNCLCSAHGPQRPVHQYLISRWWYMKPELVGIKVRVYRLWCPFEKWYQSSYTLIRRKMSQRCQGYLLLKYNKWVSNVIILFGEKEWIPSCYPSVMVPRHLSARATEGSDENVIIQSNLLLNVQVTRTLHVSGPSFHHNQKENYTF